ncbi:MAG: hypothetical protein J6S92_12230 [Oscillospiraceae bacterium]|nr:hypothetical protein [Oscillospiraceae bacterium]
MTKEDILAKARKENKGADVVMLEANAKANGIAGAASMLIGAVLILLSQRFCDREVPEIWVMIFTYWASHGLSKFILLRKRGCQKQSWVWLIYGAVMTVMVVLAIIRTVNFWKAGA